MELNRARRLLLSSQDVMTLTREEREAVTACLWDVFARAGALWSRDELDATVLWLREANNRRRTIVSVRLKLHARLRRRNLQVSAETGQEGFDRGMVIFVERSHTTYDPGRYPQYDNKAALLTAYFRTGVLNATLSLVVVRSRFEWIDLDEVDQSELKGAPLTPDSGLDARRYIQAMVNLLETTLAAPEADSILAMRRDRIKPEEVARQLGVAEETVADVRHATVLNYVLDDASGRADWKGTEGFDDLHDRIGMEMNIERDQVKVAVARAKRWAEGRLGKFFAKEVRVGEA